MLQTFTIQFANSSAILQWMLFSSLLSYVDGCTAVKEEWALHQIAREPPSDNFDDLLRQTLRKLKS